jgi:hypothetical protein
MDSKLAKNQLPTTHGSPSILKIFTEVQNFPHSGKLSGLPPWKWTFGE